LLPDDFQKLSMEAAMLKFSDHYQTKLIITRGADGVSFVCDDKVITVPTIATEVVDTTGAGDTFNGILAARLGIGEPLESAIKFATIGATLSTMKSGAQTGMPSLDDIERCRTF
jgi:ribokinase